MVRVETTWFKEGKWRAVLMRCVVWKRNYDALEHMRVLGSRAALVSPPHVPPSLFSLLPFSALAFTFSVASHKSFHVTSSFVVYLVVLVVRKIDYGMLTTLLRTFKIYMYLTLVCEVYTDSYSSSLENLCKEPKY